MTRWIGLNDQYDLKNYPLCIYKTSTYNRNHRVHGQKVSFIYSILCVHIYYRYSPGFFFVRLGQNSGSPKTQVQAKTQLFQAKTQGPVSLSSNFWSSIAQDLHKLVHRKRNFDIYAIFWQNSGSNFAKTQVWGHQNSGSDRENSGSNRRNSGSCLTFEMGRDKKTHNKKACTKQ